MFAGKVDDDPAIHGGVAGVISLAIAAYGAWKFDHTGICVLASIIGIFLLISCFASPFMND
ncbi:MAG: hypothetical protein II180_07975 [Proteobacteria bacterium]|nr:hypothetical protein [Pseudomonadota bacterium]